MTPEEECWRRSGSPEGQETAQASAGQREMLLPIEGKKPTRKRRPNLRPDAERLADVARPAAALLQRTQIVRHFAESLLSSHRRSRRGRISCSLNATATRQFRRDANEQTFTSSLALLAID